LGDPDEKSGQAFTTRSLLKSQGAQTDRSILIAGLSASI